MNPVKCERCEKELTAEMEIEYSRFLTRIFCNPDCAKDYYFEEAHSIPIDCSDLSENELSDYGLKVVDGKVFDIE